MTSFCQRCGREYEVYPNSDRRYCPSCKDIFQKAPSIVLDRKELVVVPAVTIVQLPPIRWRRIPPKRPTDQENYKLDIRGKALNPLLSWEGRIVVYSDAPRRVGDVVDVHVREAMHEVRVSYHRNQQGETVRRHHPIADRVRNTVIEQEKRFYLVFAPARTWEASKHILTWTEFDPSPATLCWPFRSGDKTFYLSVVENG